MVTYSKKKGKDMHFNGVMPIPARATLRTRYFKHLVISNAGFPFANIRFQPTFGDAVDPVIAGGAMPFYNAMASFYRQARLEHAKIKVHFTNLESFPVTCALCPVNFDPNPNTATFYGYYANPLSKSKLVSPKSGLDLITLSCSASTDFFGGSKWTGTADQYTYTIGTSTPPSNNWFFFVGAQPISTGSFVNGVEASITLDCTYVFFEETSPVA